MNIQGWTESEEVTLASLWAGGLTAREIGLELGRSRNAILGKADRLGLPLRGKVVSRVKRTEREKLPPKEKHQAPQVRVRLRVVREKTKSVERERLWHPLDDSTLPVTLIDRRRTQCAWPLDLPHEPGLNVVCGKDTWGDCVYCATHYNIAYLPRKARQ